MGETKNNTCVQFVGFSSKEEIGEELFEETWTPVAKGLRARGIDLIVLSKNTNSKNDSCEYVYISKIRWDSKNAIQVAFPGGLKLSGLARPTRAQVITTQIGCFHVRSTKVADKDLDPKRHEKLVEHEVKIYIMIAQSLSSEEVISKGQTLRLVKGFQSYCIYELDKQFSGDGSGLYSWIIEAYIQGFFKDTVLQEISHIEQLKDCKITVHEDVIQFTM